MRTKPSIFAGLSGLAGLALIGAAFAVDYPAPIVAAQSAGFKIHESFDAGDGMTGWATSGQDRDVIIYTTPSGTQALIGVMLDATGRNLTEGHLAQYVPKPDYTAAWARLASAAVVSEGNPVSGNVVYVFMEPNCGYCHRFWEASRPYVETGKVELRHIMVSFLHQSSASKNAAILEAANPAALLAEHEDAFQSGGIDGIAAPKEETIAALEHNNGLMRELGLQGTPAIVFRNADGQVEIVKGLPPPTQMPLIFNLSATDVARSSNQ